MKQKILVLSSGILPVPASKGGAVENLIQHICNANETSKDFEITVMSIYDFKAVEISKKYQKSKFIFVNSNFFIKICDKIIYMIFTKLLKKTNAMTYRYPIQRIYFIYRCSKEMKNSDYDKILIENSSSLFLALKWKHNCKKYEGKYYFHLHNEISKSYGCMNIIRNSKKIMCVSEFIKKSIANYLNISEKSSNLVVIKNCIDINKFNGEISKEEKEKILKKYKIPKNKKIIIFTGRLTKEKGIEELLHALRKLKSTNFVLLIVGNYFFDSNITNDFSTKINKLKEQLKEKIIFTGFIRYEELSKIYAISDFAVLPSIWDEPAGLTVLEALASNLPLITTNSGGIPEYASNVSAIIIKRNDKIIDSLTENIELLLNDESLLQNMKKNARKSVVKFSIQNYFENIKNSINGDRYEK